MQYRIFINTEIPKICQIKIFTHLQSLLRVIVFSLSSDPLHIIMSGQGKDVRNNQ
jgi:hypothetical protein